MFFADLWRRWNEKLGLIISIFTMQASFQLITNRLTSTSTIRFMIKCGMPRWSQNNRRSRLPHLGINNVTTYGSVTKPFALQQLRLNLLIRRISDSDKLKITLSSVNYPVLTILPTPNYYGMVYLSRVRLHAEPTCVINSYPFDVIWSSLTFARKVVVFKRMPRKYINM